MNGSTITFSISRPVNDEQQQMPPKKARSFLRTNKPHLIHAVLEFMWGNRMSSLKCFLRQKPAGVLNHETALSSC